MVQTTTAIKNKIAMRYSKALYDSLAPKTRELVATNLHYLKAIWQNKDFEHALSSPFSDQSLLRSILDQIVQEQKFDSKFKNFLYLLLKNNRISLLSEISLAYDQLLAFDKKELKVNLRTANLLSDKQQEEIKQLLGKITNKQISLNMQKDSSLIGGFIANFGSHQIDTSILTKINSLKTALKEVN